MTPADTLAAEYGRIREALLAEYPDIDPETLADTLEGLSDLPDVLARMIRDAREDKAMADALGVMIAESRERQERLNRRSLSRRNAVLRLMSTACLRKIEQPDFMASIRHVPPKVEITDDTSIPDAFQKVVKTPDKPAIKAALERGETVQGAVLGNGSEGLSVRFK